MCLRQSQGNVGLVEPYKVFLYIFIRMKKKIISIIAKIYDKREYVCILCISTKSNISHTINLYEEENF